MAIGHTQARTHTYCIQVVDGGVMGATPLHRERDRDSNLGTAILKGHQLLDRVFSYTNSCGGHGTKKSLRRRTFSMLEDKTRHKRHTHIHRAFHKTRTHTSSSSFPTTDFPSPPSRSSHSHAICTRISRKSLAIRAPEGAGRPRVPRRSSILRTMLDVFRFFYTGYGKTQHACNGVLQ